ncbi:MAG: hypothetical protein K1Y02_21805 [Candidatus Hydrogenedentes bacterium]|nr:hypothetical protein [Candidatus Hydrogenedentota bacterium]
MDTLREVPHVVDMALIRCEILVPDRCHGKAPPLALSSAAKSLFEIFAAFLARRATLLRMKLRASNALISSASRFNF